MTRYDQSQESASRSTGSVVYVQASAHTRVTAQCTPGCNSAGVQNSFASGNGLLPSVIVNSAVSLNMRRITIQKNIPLTKFPPGAGFLTCKEPTRL